MDEVLGPFTGYRTTVPATWLDYNGHMHDASYGIALSDANEELFASLGLSREYREQTAAALYTVEYHIRYLAECGLGQALTATTLVLAASAKWVHLYTELLRDGSDVAATGESLYLHVDTTRSVTTPLPVDRQHRVQAMVAAHAELPRPSHLGRGVGSRV
jgi:acyl-CoA thioester hydrolase